MLASELVKWLSVRILKGAFAGATQTPDVVHIKIDRIHYSKLDVERSMLDVRYFLLLIGAEFKNNQRNIIFLGFGTPKFSDRIHDRLTHSLSFKP